MKSDGVKDVFKWLEKRCKEQKQKVDISENYYYFAKRHYIYDDEQCLIESAKIKFEVEKAKLEVLVQTKISIEKYMRKLRHQGE